ncbi:MAG: metal-dependent transcriptional regulator [Ezakiella sp.]|nr:metal-dependent transcriptional regulator [Ezakiella sp.]MDD7761732.1 metal-dependent transcriptional regulator [Bacillota bacterium]MDY3947032.1 metal-dependent transcriptional regulator [Ezakiella sp.]
MANESQEMYLKTILLLHLKNKPARSIDVANELGYSKASVSRALGLLKDEGYVTVEQGGTIVFTDEGRAKALDVYDRYVFLRDALLRLGVDEETAHEDACKMEHVVSDITLKKLKDFVLS